MSSSMSTAETPETGAVPGGADQRLQEQRFAILADYEAMDRKPVVHAVAGFRLGGTQGRGGGAGDRGLASCVGASIFAMTRRKR